MRGLCLRFSLRTSTDVDPTALLYYDYVLTFQKEIRYIWGEKFRFSTALYICCRYALVANVLYLLAIADKLGSTVRDIDTLAPCDVWYKIIGALSIFGRAAVIAVFVMRTYAVFGRNAWVLAYMGIVGVACVALDITHVPGLHCVGSSTPEMLSILMVIFESSSAVLTTVRCLVAFRAGGGIQTHRNGVMFILFEQGSYIYYSRSTPTAKIHRFSLQPGFLQRLLDAFLLPLSCILTARFILYLREWDAEMTKGGATQVSKLEFRAAAASGSGVLSEIVGIDDFGVDPIVLAAASRGKEKDTELRVGNVPEIDERAAGDSSGHVQSGLYDL
ncbi:hypothetical protein GGX14DRAFT_527784 [Mycena pura]|uniref:DUF6533 domain-containing protein n=1 Tax=Mycena pura TaxID=153505 RepID=A0AAD6Y0L2_9AGAR|nr:hypothetical protein GGX14DRAFT_527784 [Mycena pura]